jgi:tellurite methyltransferase
VDCSGTRHHPLAMIDADYWARYYAVTVDRPAWDTVRLAIERFAAEPAGAGVERLAVDLGCGAGRDARALLRAGWSVLAIDREPGAIATLETATAADLRPALRTLVADVGEVDIPPCHLVNANLILPFLAPGAFWATWDRILTALPTGGRLAAMLFGDRDGGAGDPTMTHPSPDAIRSRLVEFDLVYWIDREDDSETALGEPHHFHRIELVARRIR